MIMYHRHTRSDGRLCVEFVFPGTGKRIRKIITLEEYTKRIIKAEEEAEDAHRAAFQD